MLLKVYRTFVCSCVWCTFLQRELERIVIPASFRTWSRPYPCLCLFQALQLRNSYANLSANLLLIYDLNMIKYWYDWMIADLTLNVKSFFHMWQGQACLTNFCRKKASKLYSRMLVLPVSLLDVTCHLWCVRCIF